MPEIGDELIYRLREYAESERVRVEEIDARKKTPRYVVEFLDGDKAGTQENVPAGRLRGPWAGAGEYDALMANWERIDQVQLTDVEDSAVGQVFDLLITDEIAEWEWSPVRYATRIHDREALRELIGITVDDLLAQAEGFELDGDLMVSPDATLMIAEYACRIKPMPVLDWILEEEKEYQEKSKNGRPAVSHLHDVAGVGVPDVPRTRASPSRTAAFMVRPACRNAARAARCRRSREPATRRAHHPPFR